MDKIKDWKNGEEFVFDGVKKVPVVGALYAVPRTITYGLMGNKTQSFGSAKGFVDNVKSTAGIGAGLLITPVTLISNMGGKIISKATGSGKGDSQN